jgi:hypothetical protein
LTSGICSSKHVSLRRMQISRQVCTWPVGLFNEGKDPSIWWSNEAGKIRGKLRLNSFKLVWIQIARAESCLCFHFIS